MTFMEHVHELRRRLFLVALWFVGVTIATIPFFHDIIKLLMWPLGSEKLYYLTPIGGLGFMIKVGMYLGLIATLPIFLYHLYGFIAPAIARYRKSTRQVITYVTISFLLAIIGIAFAYTISLPAALHFLTNIQISGVSAMLTVDSYLSFIIAYLFAGALLFQLPLIMVIFDSARPTPPSQWNKYQRHVIVGSLIVGMLVTPTPNIIDQVIIAVPMVLMYQVGIGVIYFRHRKRKSQKIAVPIKKLQPASSHQRPTPRVVSTIKTSTPQSFTPMKPVIAAPVKHQSMDIVARHQVKVPLSRNRPAIPIRPVASLQRSIDGVSMVKITS